MKSNYRETKSIQSPVMLEQNHQIAQHGPEYQTPISTLIDSWLETKRSAQTRRAYRRDVVDFCVYVGMMTIDDLQVYPIPQLSHQILDWLKTQYQYDEHNPDKVLNPTTINRKAYAVSSWFEYLMAVYQYPKNPAKIFTPLKTVKYSTTDSLTKLEYVSLLDYQKEQYMRSKVKGQRSNVQKDWLTIIKELRDYLMLALMSMSLRRNEVVKLRWSDIDDSTTVHLTVYQKWGSTKLIPLPSSIFELLMQLGQNKMTMWLVSDYIFSPIKNNSTGDLTKPISADYVFELIKKLAAVCWIDKKITPHSLRKTFIELALDSKEDYINIANATGHSTLEMIKYYDTRSKLEKNAVNNMGDIF
jgi:integrase/recombinase XerD